jgi:putative transcriptional regulator
MGEIPVSQVAKLRELAGLTQRQLADAVGVTESTIRNLEKNRNGIEQIERVVRLCRVLNCGAEDLIEYKSVEGGEIPVTPSEPSRLDRIEALLGALADRQDGTQRQLDQSVAISNARAETIFLAIQQIVEQQQAAQADFRASITDVVQVFTTLAEQVAEMQSEVRGLQTENRRILDILQNRADDRE